MPAGAEGITEARLRCIGPLGFRRRELETQEMVRGMDRCGPFGLWRHPVGWLALCAALILAGAVGGAQTPEGPADLRSGQVDVTPLSDRRGTTDSGAPLMPPQTVEGTLLALDESAREMTVRTEHFGDVKVGVPPDLVPMRRGEDSSLSAIREGDRVYATVETAYGVRAVRIVSEPPMNPLVNYIGIPALLLIALAIWWTGRKRNAESG